MTPEQRRRVRDLFEAAIDRETITPPVLAAWIAQQAADDPAVRDEVRSLLEHHTRAGQFLEAPVLDRVPHLLADDEPLQPGSAIGPYRIVRELGRGGMGRVYLASDSRLGRSVALKAIAPALAGDASQRERLRREARVVAGLVHPGICIVYALEEIDGELYLASEFVDGRTLREAIADRPRPSAGDVLRLARELADALAYAHERGVVHRDLKPENIMLTAGGDGVRVKILDFGLARLDSADRPQPSPFVTASGVVVGTPAYMAPEQMQGRVDARADVFAFGIVVHEYATGAHPFSGAAGPAALDGAVADVVARCLRQNPSERFASAADVAAALGRAGSTIPGSGVHTAWWRTHQIVIVALYAIAAVLAWQLKEWERSPVSIALFVALGAASTIGVVLRGHLLFTERVNRGGLADERRQAGRPTQLIDVLVSAMLFIDGMLITDRPLPSL
ncbi:MAG TPA: serine/threonine-protein kinase, partial [Vicinamibacterales bacterium]|nr:serine/threonine-protein kinase [Vicinamibacterales bacterium]